MIKRSKKGVTLVELIASIAIISMVLVASVTGIILSQESVYNDMQKEEASFKAQSIADELMVEMSGKTYSQNLNNALPGNPLNVVDGAKYVSVTSANNFPQNKTNGDMQYSIMEYSQNINSIHMKGTQILVAVYYNTDEYVIIEAFAPEVEAD